MRWEENIEETCESRPPSIIKIVSLTGSFLMGKPVSVICGWVGQQAFIVAHRVMVVRKVATRAKWIPLQFDSVGEQC